MYYLSYLGLLGKELLCLSILSLPLGRILKRLVVFGNMLILLNQWLSNMMTNLSFLCRWIGLLLQIPLMREPIAGSVKGHRVCRRASFTLGCVVSVLSSGSPKGKIKRECNTFVYFLVESLYKLDVVQFQAEKAQTFPFPPQPPVAEVTSLPRQVFICFQDHFSGSVLEKPLAS